MSSQEKLVVIGGSAAGMSAASRARKLRSDMEIKVFERSPHISYAACGMPYLISGRVKTPQDLVAYEPEFFEQQRDIEIFLNHEVRTIDIARRTVGVQHVKTGAETKYHYGKLLVTSGAGAVVPPLKGIDLDGVFILRSLEDGIRIKDFIDTMRPASGLIIGAGSVGLEMAEAFTERGIKTTLVERLPGILGSMDADIGNVAIEELRDKGVSVMTSRSVVELVGNGSFVARVSLDQEAPVEAGIVVVSVGIRPNVSVATEAGIELGGTGAIKVNERMETSVPGVYAAGDCAEAYHLVLGRNAYMPLGTTANKQGRVAGENIAGGDACFSGIVGTSVLKLFDLEVGRTGVSEQEARQERMDYIANVTEHRSRASYCPGRARIMTKLVADRATGRVLGAQMVGREGVSLRIGIFATAMMAGMTLKDVASLDLGYSPPLAPVYDPVLIAASDLMKLMKSG